MTRHEQLADFLDRALERPFVWGVWDCCQMVRAWVLETHRVDVASGPGWRYSTEIGAALLCCRAGGLVGLLDKAFAPLGLVHTEEPDIGDIGAAMVMSAGGVVPVAAIRTAGGWAHLQQGGGIARLEAPTLKAWRV